MIARTSLKIMLSQSAHNKVGMLILPSRVDTQKRFNSSSSNSSSNSFNDNNKTDKKDKVQPNSKKTLAPPDIPSFMPVVNIPEAELAHNAFYSLHRPLLGLSIPRPFLVGGIVGQIKEDSSNKNDSEEALLQYMMSLKPFEPPRMDTLKEEEKSSSTTLTVEVDPSYFMNHNNNHDEIADYLTAMQEKLDLLYDEKHKRKFSSSPNFITKKTTSKTRRLRKRKGFFEKN